jgi:hypothetical protein
MRRLPAIAAAGALLVLLASCSMPSEFAMRLNSDGTVDYLDCSGPLGYVNVDYRYEVGEQGSIEWEATQPLGAGAADVAYYGEVPPGWDERYTAFRPPLGWTFVSTSAGGVYRESLDEGEWEWFTVSTWDWIPEHPCDGWELDSDGEPRRTS